MHNHLDSTLSFRTIQTVLVEEWYIPKGVFHRWLKIINKTNRNGKTKEMDSKAFLCHSGSVKIRSTSTVAKMHYSSRTRSRQWITINLGTLEQGISQVRASRPILRRSRVRKYFRERLGLVTRPTWNLHCQTINSHVKPQEPTPILLAASQMKAEPQHWVTPKIWYPYRTRLPRTRGIWLLIL